MSGWLVFWLCLAAIGPISWVSLWAFEDRIDDGYEALGVAIIMIMLLLISAVGFLGTLGWLVAWGFG